VQVQNFKVWYDGICLEYLRTHGKLYKNPNDGTGMVVVDEAPNQLPIEKRNDP